jgi:lysophospholipase L1-like esterase
MSTSAPRGQGHAWIVCLAASVIAALCSGATGCSSSNSASNGDASLPYAGPDTGATGSGDSAIARDAERESLTDSQATSGSDASIPASREASTTTSNDASMSTSREASTTTSNDASMSSFGDASTHPPNADGGDSGGHGGVLNIMALGDSITRDTCWRALLWQKLHQNFPSRFHLVGSLNFDPGCSVSGYETANQGYASSLITECVAGVTTARTCDPFCPALSDLTTAFGSVKPDVLLLHWGTNDVWNNVSSTNIVNAYSTVIDAVRTANSKVIILLAQIIPMNVTATTCSGCSCPTCPAAVPALDTAIRNFAPTKSTAASPIIVVDQYTGFDAVADTSDGVHPNSTTGSMKMANNWYAALSTLF